MVKKTVLRRVFRASVELPRSAEEKLFFLSRCLVHLWNMARAECERRLAEVQDIRKALKVFRDTGIVGVYGTKIIDEENAKTLLADLGINAISLNFWLTPVRKQTITLDDGIEVRLEDISSDLERETLRKLAGSYKSFFALKKNKDFRARKPEQKLEQWFQTMSWSSFRIKEGTLFVPGYQGERIAIPLTTTTAGETSAGDYLKKQIAGKQVVFVTLSRDRWSGQFVLSLVTSAPLPQEVCGRKLVRAIDLGARNIAVTDSDGSEYLIPTRRPDPFWMGRFLNDHIAAVEARQKKRTRGSRGWKRLAEARRRMFAYSREQKVWFQRIVAAALVSEDIQCVIVGKPPRIRLGLAKTRSSPAQHYGAQNTGYLFRQLQNIRNKAEERGVRYLELPDPRRKGELDDPESKLNASRELLRWGLEQTGLPIAYPASFELKKFRINFGKGVPKKAVSS